MNDIEKRFYFFIGTKAELIKLMGVIQEFQKHHIPFKIIASGQNNIAQSDIFKLLNLKIDINLYEKSVQPSILFFAIWFFKTFFKALINLRSEFKNIKRGKSYIIIHGDTPSSLIGALVGKRYGLKIAHVEAGYQSLDLFHPFPEEINRKIISYLADIHFCSYEKNVLNLKNRKGLKINTFYNTGIDSVQFALAQPIESHLINRLKEKPYFIFVLHRQEHLFNKALALKLLTFLEETAGRLKGVFILHDPTRAFLEKMNLLDRFKAHTNIELISPLPYVEFIRLLKGSAFIMGDGGSNQQEAFYLGKPCLLLRGVLEGEEGVGSNAILSKYNPEVIRNFTQNYQHYQKLPIVPEVIPSKIVVNVLTTQS